MSTKSISLTSSVDNLIKTTTTNTISTQSGQNINKLIIDDNKIKDQINRTKFGRLLNVKKDT